MLHEELINFNQFYVYSISIHDKADISVKKSKSLFCCIKNGSNANAPEPFFLQYEHMLQHVLFLNRYN